MTNSNPEQPGIDLDSLEAKAKRGDYITRAHQLTLISLARSAITQQAEAPQSVQAGEVVDERALFEAWAKSVGYNVQAFKAEDETAYSATFANVAWEGFKAGRATLAPVAAQPEEIKREAAKIAIHLDAMKSNEHYRERVFNQIVQIDAEAGMHRFERVAAQPVGAADSPVSETGELIAAAEKNAEAYDGDDREGIKTDVINAFYQGAAWQARATQQEGE